MTAPSVAVRMYNVGFGDAFRVTVTKGDQTWRMLVDCGVHSQGQARGIEESVDAVIGDLVDAGGDGTAHLDVVVATHHHADHISGFSLPAWERVQVDEVWLPFVEDPSDPDAVALRRAHTATTQRLLELLARRTTGLAEEGWPAAVREAHGFALNSFGNADATDRLTGRNGQHFAGEHRVRYLPSTDQAMNTIATGLDGVVAHVLGPSRDPADLERMNPPAGAGWQRLDAEERPADRAAGVPLFDAEYVVADPGRLPEVLTRAQRALDLGELSNDVGLLGAASILERAVNNTSIFLVLEVAGRRLVFPGDSQEGAWRHVLDDPPKRALLQDAVFYKIGHHGSHNATPRSFVEEVWHDGGYAMLPWGLVRNWEKTIPERHLLDALHAHGHTVIRADAPIAVPGEVTVHGDLWSEVVFPAED